VKRRLDILRFPFFRWNFNVSELSCKYLNFNTLDQFKHRMAIEKRRSERANCTSSIILLNTQRIVNKISQKKQLTIEEVTRFVCRTIRATDAVSIYKDSTILILLVDANYLGAHCACKRIVSNIMGYYSSRCQLSPNDFHIKILSYPENKIKKHGTGVTAFINPASVKARRSSDARTSKDMTFRCDYLKNLNLCISTFNGTVCSIRIEDVFFWDHNLVSKHILAFSRIIKRILDLAGASILIALSSPFMLIIAVSIKLTSPGPVLFKQRRVGYKGDYFTFMKFRTMFTGNADSTHHEYVRKLISGEVDQINMGTQQHPFFKMKHDPRVTPFGRFLRKTSLDELPQFFNVLKGEMSLVGPRPPIPYEVDEYKKWHYRRILDVKPGITGLWQVSGRNRTSFDEMVRLDIRYAETWSLKQDLKILLRTVRVILAADGE